MIVGRFLGGEDVLDQRLCWIAGLDQVAGPTPVVARAHDPLFRRSDTNVLPHEGLVAA